MLWPIWKCPRGDFPHILWEHKYMSSFCGSILAHERNFPYVHCIINWSVSLNPSHWGSYYVTIARYLHLLISACLMQTEFCKMLQFNERLLPFIVWLRNINHHLSLDTFADLPVGRHTYLPNTRISKLVLLVRYTMGNLAFLPPLPSLSGTS